jgi:hypothetical protein
MLRDPTQQSQTDESALEAVNMTLDSEIHNMKHLPTQQDDKEETWESFDQGEIGKHEEEDEDEDRHVFPPDEMLVDDDDNATNMKNSRVSDIEVVRDADSIESVKVRSNRFYFSLTNILFPTEFLFYRLEEFRLPCPLWVIQMKSSPSQLPDRRIPPSWEHPLQYQMMTRNLPHLRLKKNKTKIFNSMIIHPNPKDVSLKMIRILSCPAQMLHVTVLQLMLPRLLP